MHNVQLQSGKWNESGFRPPLCTYRLNWARITSWGWWDDWDDTVLQTQDSKFEPWRSEAEHATSRSRRLPTILTFTRGWGRNIICFFQTAETGNRTPNSGVKGSGANHYPRAPALQSGSFSKGTIHCSVYNYHAEFDSRINHPETMRCWSITSVMLVDSLRHWSSINPAMAVLVFTSCDAWCTSVKDFLYVRAVKISHGMYPRFRVSEIDLGRLKWEGKWTKFSCRPITKHHVQ